jgi:glutamate--cysteine ligase catalytic subunit
MERAQHRDAVRKEKFFFRKDVYLPGHTPPSSDASSSSEEVPVPLRITRRTNRKLGNCFGPLPPPQEEDRASSWSVEDEYEEMTLEEIMTGKVGLYVLMEHCKPDRSLPRARRFLDCLLLYTGIWRASL